MEFLQFKGDFVATTIRRHALSMLKRMTPTRFANLCLALYEAKTRKTILKSYPIYLRINVSPFCNLRCPGCEAGGAGIAAKYRELHKGQACMSFSVFKKCVDPLKKYIFKMNLYDEGEPLLNHEIEQMISYASRHNITTCISSNLSIDLPDSRIRDIVNSGLDHIMVAVDGSTQGVYEKYRVGGNLALVLDNLKRMVSIKSALNKKNLFIDIQFLVFEHNKHQLEDMKLLARKLKVDRLTAIKASTLGWEAWDSLGSKLNPEQRRNLGCYLIWFTADIESDGKLYSCDYSEDHLMPAIGSMLENPFVELWNHRVMQQLRFSFRKSGKANLSDFCRNCPCWTIALLH